MIKSRKAVQNIILCLIFLLLPTGCNGISLTSGTPSPQPTQTPLPSNTPMPTATATQTATLTPTPSPEPSATLTITPQPTKDAVEKGLLYILGGAGFKVRIFKNLVIDIDVVKDIAFINDMDQTFIAYLFTTEKFSSANNVVLLQDIKSWLQSNFSNLTMEETSPISVDGKKGQVANISGKITNTDLTGTPFLGQVVMIVLDNNRVFISVALGLNSNGKDTWKTVGQTQFTAILESVKFFEPQKGANLCKVSTDPTYGYSEKNPIRLGCLSRQENSDPLSLLDRAWEAGCPGPRNEKAYLINLRGPAGQEITYNRLGSYGGIDDAILDGYEVQYAGLAKPVTLYLDMYTYQDLVIPLGFTCYTTIPIAAPGE